MGADYHDSDLSSQHLRGCSFNHNHVMNTLAARLKKAREDAGLTQGQLAKVAKVRGQSLIGNLEAGSRKSTSKIAQIAAALGVDALWLATGKGDPRHPATVAGEPGAAPYGSAMPLTPEEQAMLDTFRKLTREQRNELLRGADETQQANAQIIAELTGKSSNGTDG